MEDGVAYHNLAPHLVVIVLTKLSMMANILDYACLLQRAYESLSMDHRNILEIAITLAMMESTPTYYHHSNYFLLNITCVKRY